MLQTNEDGEILTYNHDGGFCFETDDWSEVLKAINALDELHECFKE